MVRITAVALLVLISFLVHAKETDEVIWNTDKTAYASCSNGVIPTCQVVVRGTKVDVSHVTYSNLGKLGIATADEYQKIVTKPISWLKNTTDIQMVEFKTHAWLNGKRYTVTEPVLVKDGRYFGR